MPWPSATLGGWQFPYESLPDAVADRIAPHFDLAVDAVQRVMMAAAAGRDAKNPVLEFAADSARKQAAATPEMLRECAARVDPLVDLLRSRHAEQPHPATGRSRVP